MTNKKEPEITIHNECWYCVSKEEVPGNAHIKCSNPDKQMRGHLHGIRSGWFYYPMLFDPTWKTVKCNNFVKKD